MVRVLQVDRGLEPKGAAVKHAVSFLFLAAFLSLSSSGETDQSHIPVTSASSEAHSVKAGSCQSELKTCQEERAEAAKKLKNLKFVCHALCGTRKNRLLSGYTFSIVSSHHEEIGKAFQGLNLECEKLGRKKGEDRTQIVAYSPDGYSAAYPVEPQTNCIRTGE